MCDTRGVVDGAADKVGHRVVLRAGDPSRGLGLILAFGGAIGVVAGVGVLLSAHRNWGGGLTGLGAGGVFAWTGLGLFLASVTVDADGITNRRYMSPKRIIHKANIAGIEVRPAMGVTPGQITIFVDRTDGKKSMQLQTLQAYDSATSRARLQGYVQQMNGALGRTSRPAE